MHAVTYDTLGPEPERESGSLHLSIGTCRLDLNRTSLDVQSLTDNYHSKSTVGTLVSEMADTQKCNVVSSRYMAHMRMRGDLPSAQQIQAELEPRLLRGTASPAVLAS